MVHCSWRARVFVWLVFKGLQHAKALNAVGKISQEEQRVLDNATRAIRVAECRESKRRMFALRRQVAPSKPRRDEGDEETDEL